ncbi:hypothetical protein GCM10009101_10910 [Brevundimonas lenta]
MHLAQLKREGIEFWFDGDITPGSEIDANVRRAMKAADIFVALASPDYLHSSYCFDKEYSPALRKAARGGIRVVVAILRDCQWKHTRMAAYKALPTDGKPVDHWPRRGDAYEEIVNGLREVIKAVSAVKAGLPPKRRSTASTAPKKPVSPKIASPGAKKPQPARTLKAKPAKAKAKAKPGATKPKSGASTQPRRAVKVRPKKPRGPSPSR